jgi:hypothetical protein
MIIFTGGKMCSRMESGGEPRRRKGRGSSHKKAGEIFEAPNMKVPSSMNLVKFRMRTLGIKSKSA